MKRTIKFRGVRMSDGETIYGYYHVRGGAAFIDEWRVDPETVAQLVWLDDNGDEIYEGDTLVGGDDGYEYIAALEPEAESEDDLIHFGDYAADGVGTCPAYMDVGDHFVTLREKLYLKK